MVESTILNPEDEKITHYFGEINGFVRSTCTVNTNNKKQMGVGGSGRNGKSIHSDFKAEIQIRFRSDRCYLHNAFLKE